MTKFEKRKMTVIIIGIIILLVVVIGGGFLLFGKKDNYIISDPDIPNEVSPEHALDIFNDLTKECSGAMVWNIKLGESVEIHNIEDYRNSCKTENYYSKMIGYTYDINDNLVLHVNVLKKVNDNVYKLDDTFVGVYLEENINLLLDEGTTYIYTYHKNENAYQLFKVELMDSSIPEETSHNDNLEDVKE